MRLSERLAQHNAAVKTHKRSYTLSIAPSILAPQWQYYANHSSETDRGKADEFGHAREEQLNEVLLAIELGDVFDEECQARLDRIPQNRAKKHRRLRVVAKHHVSTIESVASDCAERADLIASVRVILTPREWTVEFRLSSGATYDVLAREYETSPGALKVQVCRWRVRVREQMGM